MTKVNDVRLIQYAKLFYKYAFILQLSEGNRCLFHWQQSSITIASTSALLCQFSESI